MKALTVSKEDMLRLDGAEGATRREEAQERMDAERLVARREVADAAEGIAADENSLLGEPESDLPPEPSPHERQHDERRTGHVREGRDVKRNAESLRNRCVVALVTVDELDDADRLAERADPLVDPWAVDDVRQPDAPSGEDGVRRPPKPLAFGAPAESVVELVEKSELHGNTMAVTPEKGTSNAEIADRLETFATLLDHG